jgi:hypothetical protein
MEFADGNLDQRIQTVRHEKANALFVDLARQHFEDHHQIICFDLPNSDGRTASHIWNVFFLPKTATHTDSFFANLTQLLEEKRFDTERHRLEQILVSDVYIDDVEDHAKYVVELLYRRNPANQPVAAVEPIEEPVILEAIELPVQASIQRIHNRPASQARTGRYEESRTNLFREMFKFVVEKKIQEGEQCSICFSDDKPHTEYFLCPKLHLICRECRSNWKRQARQFGANACPTCRELCSYEYVITPPAYLILDE